MVKFIAAAALLAAFAQEKNANPDLLYKKEVGISISKPPKNEEWEFKDQGQLQGSQVVVAHKVDTITIEVFVQEPEGSSGGLSVGVWDPRAAAVNQWEAISKSPNFKDAKIKSDPSKGTKLPGGAASGVGAYHLDMTMKTKEEKTLEWKMWVFVAKESRCLVKVSIMGEEKLYTKHRKFVDFIVSSLQTLRLPKKK
jgi:hypothetical protein